ncbi:MAG: PAS domain S-box protein [Spirochaetales bacterium]|nr:PAS domain S-box protein [Spirochaetales bacterium]
MNENGLRICIKDLSRKYIYCNELFAADLGMDVSDILGRDDFDFGDRSAAEEFLRHDMSVLESGKPVISCVRRDLRGKECFFKVSRIPYITGNSELSGILAISEEINGELFLRERLVETSQEAEAFEIWEIDSTEGSIFKHESSGNLFSKSEPGSLKELEALFHREDRGKLTARIGACARTEGSFRIQLRLIEIPEDQRWIELFGIFRGNKAHVLISDTSRQVRLEKTLLLYEQAFANSIAGIILTDSCGAIIRVNDSFIKMMGGQNKLFEISEKTDILAERREDWLRIMAEISRNGFWKGRLSVTRSDGKPFMTFLTVNRIMSEEDSIDYLLWTFLDISEKYNLEKKIKSLGEQFEAFIGTTMDGYWLIDEGGSILDCNRRACDMLGFSREEMIGKNVGEIDVVEDREALEQHIGIVVESGSDIFKTKHRKKNGDLLDIQVSSTYWAEKKLFIGFVRDITDIEKNKKELEELNIALRIVIESERSSNLTSEKNMNLTLQKTVIPLLNQLSESCSDNQKEIIRLVKDSLNLVESYPAELTALLTPKELQIAQMIYQGYVSKEIGNVLNMSGRTVENYRQAIRKKLRIEDSSENLNNIIAGYFNRM